MSNEECSVSMLVADFLHYVCTDHYCFLLVQAPGLVCQQTHYLSAKNTHHGRLSPGQHGVNLYNRPDISIDLSLIQKTQGKFQIPSFR